MSHQVKVQCQKGIPASLRAKCWPLLCGATDRMKQNENLYQTLEIQSALQSWVDVIERDLDRQFPFHEMFLSKDGHGQRGLFRVLKAYTQYQPEEGYCQAQGPVAAVLLMNMPAEEAFWCLVQISEQYLPGYYSPLLEGVLFDASMLTWVLKRTCPAAHKHLQHHGVEPLMFATDWLMCLFTRHLPFNTLLRVWDLFFCYGVRVLLQVAVVLVRRVLGRAEQRKACPGQMETLERLRGVREEVQDEEDSFIAEVCSVPLSARDLEKQTVKELQKWRKDRPSSTFDPRGRCQGYQMAWARARQSEEDRDKKERAEGNLSAPIVRSASTLSLSPSILQKKWKKGAKTNAGESDRKIVRHLSMNAKDDWKSWTELNLRKVQGFQEEEDVVLEEHKKQRELKTAGQCEREKRDNIQKVAKEKAEESGDAVKEKTERVEGISEKEESQVQGTEESKIQSEQTQETEMELKQTHIPAKDDQAVENFLHPTDGATHIEQGEKPETEIQVQVLVEEPQQNSGQETDTGKKEERGKDNMQSEAEGDSHPVGDPDPEAEAGPEAIADPDPVADPKAEAEAEADPDPEAEAEADPKAEDDLGPDPDPDPDPDADKNPEAEKEENVNSGEELMTQDDPKLEESTETSVVQHTKVETIAKVSNTTTDTSPSSEDESKSEAPATSTEETKTQEQHQEVIADTNEPLQRDAFEETNITDLLAEPEREKQSKAKEETKVDSLMQTQETAEENAAACDKLEAGMAQIDRKKTIEVKTEAQILITCSPEGVRPQETERETFLVDTVTESSDHYTEEECDAVASEPTQETEEGSTSEDCEARNTQTQAVEAAAQTQPNEDAADSTEPVPDLTAEPDGKTSSDAPAPEQPDNQDITDAVEEEEEECTENFQEKTGEKDNGFVSTESSTTEQAQVQVEESHLVEDESELTNSSLAQAFGQRSSSRSSGDFCVRRSSTSRGSRLGRRLSEDLFVTPQKTIQSLPNEPDSEQSNPGDVSATPTPPDVTQPSQVNSSPTDRSDVPQEQEPSDRPKRFGLFRRLRGEQQKNTKAKGTPKMPVPKILIQDFSDGVGVEKSLEKEEEKLSSRERRRRRRERERKEKEEEKTRKKKEKEQEKERERRKPQTRGKSFQVQREKGSKDEPQAEKAAAQKQSVSYSEAYF
ncbi:uncharacterized protein V6R79_015485 [Siganus canaliculatus]